ncbi:MAG TPA: hypothetical protein VLJ57_25295 [Burkholderiaceae bacterium]|nr:hypothetical protein [Burkholderiaceae bacterium]
MTDADLDHSYSVLCETLAEVGPQQAPLFLAMVCLSLMSRAGSADEVLPLIANAHRQCAAKAADAT